MQITCHTVSEERLRKATENFSARIDRSVDLQQEAGPSAGFGWEMIGDDLLDYAAARALTSPESSADTWNALNSAAQAYLGSLVFTSTPPNTPFAVMISRTGTGISYDGGLGQEVTASDVDQALCLWIVTGHQRSEETTLRSLVREPPSFQGVLSGLVFDVEGTGTGRAEDCREGRALNALLDDDPDTFWPEVADMLARHRDGLREDPAPRTLLPLKPLALTVLAVRHKGWEQRVESGYLPPLVVAGPSADGSRPRVGPFGAGKKPVLGPLEVERPGIEGCEAAVAHLDAECRDALETIWNVKSRLYGLTSRATDELWRFGLGSTCRAGTHPQQYRALESAGQYLTAAFRLTTSAEETVEVTIGDVTAPMRRARPGRHTGAWLWNQAVHLALAAGSRTRLRTLLAVPDEALDGPGPDVHVRYRRALRAYLLDREPRGPVHAALVEHKQMALRRPGLLLPPVNLLSQLVAGDEEGFTLAVVDTLEDFRDHYLVGDRRKDPDGLIHFGVLGLVRHARSSRGWEVPVESAYLPAAPDGTG